MAKQKYSVNSLKGLLKDKKADCVSIVERDNGRILLSIDEADLIEGL